MSRGRHVLSTGVVALATAAGLLTTGTTAQAGPAHAGSTGYGAPTPPAPQLEWRPCGEGLEAFQCATAKVPLDYDRPGGRTTSIALTRLPATDAEHRIGTLFTNPGGPGGSGVDFVHESAEKAFTREVRARYDIVGFDPRAVAGSDAAHCFGSQAEEERVTTSLPFAFPLTGTELGRHLSLRKRIADACVETAGAVMRHASTANVARDMDLLRRAVGDRRMHYVGYSYGTYLGATYARLFPRSVGHLVLDGTFDPAAYSGSNGDRRSQGARLGQGAAASETYQQFLRACEEAGDACALNRLGPPERVVEKLLDDLRAKPLTTPDGTTMTYSVAVGTIFQQLYAPSLWAGLAEKLAGLADPTRKGSASTPRSTTEPEPYTSVGEPLASSCVDSRHRIRPRGYQRLADAEDRAAPHFGRLRAWVGLECSFAQLRDRDAFRGPWKQAVKKPVLVIGTRYDPSTPYAHTRPYTDNFPDGRMLTVEGYGHTSLGKSTCADRTVTRYLVDGKPPKDGASCRQDAAPFAPTTGSERERRRATTTTP